MWWIRVACALKTTECKSHFWRFCRPADGVGAVAGHARRAWGHIPPHCSGAGRRPPRSEVTHQTTAGDALAAVLSAWRQGRRGAQHGVQCVWRGGPGVWGECASRDGRQGTTLQSCKENNRLCYCPTVGIRDVHRMKRFCWMAYVWCAGSALDGGLPIMQVLDGRADTKWLDFGGGTSGKATWLEVRLCVLL
jgi:hypothetical protein